MSYARTGLRFPFHVHAMVAAAAALLAFTGAARADHAVDPLGLAQYNNDLTALNAGATAKASSVVLTADSDPATCSVTYSYYLELEVRPIAQAYTGTPTHTSSTMAKATCLQQTFPNTTVAGLANGSYKWRARERTTSLASNVSNWVDYNGGLTAFVIGSVTALRAAPNHTTNSKQMDVLLIISNKT